MATAIRLVVPPFLSLARPHLGVSSLKATVHRAGHPCTVEYLNLRFASVVGPRICEWIALSDCRWLLGEWVFAPVLFGEDALPPPNAFFEEIAPELTPVQQQDLLAVRQAARAFIEAEASRLVESNPGLVGLSTSYHQTCAALALAREIKRQAPMILLCLGGANCEGEMGEALARCFPFVDTIVSGEGEDVLPALVEAVARGSREGVDRRVHARPIEDLDLLPPPEFEDYFEALKTSGFEDQVKSGLLFEASRGCYWGERRQCRYCGVNGPSLRHRRKSPERVVREIVAQHRRWGLRGFESVDNALHPKQAVALFDQLSHEGLGLEVHGEVRPDLGPEPLRRCARGGLTWVQAGIESLDDRCLSLLNKGSSLLKNIRFLRSCLEIGIRPLWVLLHRFPGEDEEALSRMVGLVPLLAHLPPPERCYPVRLDRFSPYVERPTDLGFTAVRPLPAYRHVLALPEEERAAIATFFTGEPTSAAPGAAIEALRQAAAEWKERFFTEGTRPVLTLRPFGSQTLLMDSRPTSQQTFRFLEPAEIHVLSAFRNPGRIVETLASAGPGAEEAFDALVEWGCLLRSGDRALSLPCASGERVHDWSSFTRFPGGRFLGWSAPPG